MDCHECASARVARPAVAICPFCSVGLCKDHLVAVHHAASEPLYACAHHPERAFPEVGASPAVSRAPAASRGA